MKIISLPTVWVSCFVIAVAAAGLLGGCAAPSAGTSAPKRHKGIAEYRGVTREAHRAVADVVTVLESPAMEPSQTNIPPNILTRFDQSLHHLELTSVKVRARAEAILNRGEEYFEEWKEHLSQMTNQSQVRAETKRYEWLLDCFNGIRQRSVEVRKEFGPFMTKLREFRATLDQAPSAANRPSPESLHELSLSGRRVLQSLESVSVALDDAEGKLIETLEVDREKETYR